MATIGISGNNCYADLHIYTNALPGNNEEYYSSLQQNKAPVPELNHQKAILSTKVFKNTKLLTLKNVLIVCTILVLSVSSLFIGYVTGKGACKKHEKQRLDHQAEASFTTTNGTPLSTTTDNAIPNATKRNDSSSKTTHMTDITTGRSMTVKANLGGKKFKIFVKENNKFWHFDGGHPILKAVTSKWQPSDDFVKFMFEKQMDGSYKIKSVAMPTYMYDGFGVTDAHAHVLNGNDNTDDDHMRYYISMVTQDYYRIQTKATGRYVRLDTDRYVSSRHNIKDDRSLFKLVEVYKVWYPNYTEGLHCADQLQHYLVTWSSSANLGGKKFKIFVKENNKFWHFDGGHPILKAVTSKWQPSDDFVKFMFEKQMDGSYKIKSVAMPTYMYDGFGVTDAHAHVLNGNDNTDDDHMRYYISMVTQDYYRIQTKATGRYVRLDTDRYVSSRHNIKDDRSLFKLVEV